MAPAPPTAGRTDGQTVIPSRHITFITASGRILKRAGNIPFQCILRLFSYKEL